MSEPAVAGVMQRKLMATRPAPAISLRRWRVLAVVLAAAALTMEAASLVLMVANSATTDLSQLGFNGVAILIVGLTYPIVGWLLASRRHENPIGWIFLAISVALTATLVAGQYAYYGRVVRPGAVPHDGPCLVARHLDVGPGLRARVRPGPPVPGWIAPVATLAAGRSGWLPSRPFLMAVPGAVAGVSINGLAIALAAPVDTNQPLYAIYEVGQTIGTLLMLPVGVAAIGAVVVRFRRADGIEHQQIKWFAAAGALELVLLLMTTWVTLPYPLDLLAAVAIVPLVPIAMAVAILHYRLYEIDRLISRTIAWAIVTGVLVGVFAALVVTLETVFAPITKENTFAVAASTLVAFTVVPAAPAAGPARRRPPLRPRPLRRAADGRRVRRAPAQRDGHQCRAPRLSGTTRAAVAPIALDVWIRPSSSPR